MGFCPRCGKQHAEDAAFCSGCGTKLTAVDAAAAPVQHENDIETHPNSSEAASTGVSESSEAGAVDIEGSDAAIAVPKSAIVLAWVTISLSVLAALYNTAIVTGFPNPGVLSFLLPSGWSYSGNGLTGWLSVVFGWLLMFLILAASVRVIVAGTSGSPTRRGSAVHWYDRKGILAWSPLAVASSWLLLVVVVLAMPGINSYLTPWILAKLLLNPLYWSDWSGGLPGIPVFWALIGMGIATGLLIMRAPSRSSDLSMADRSVFPQGGSRTNINTSGSPSTNPFAIASLVLSLVGILVGLAAILGVIFGHIALVQIKRNGQSGRGMALAGVIIGWTMIVLGIMVMLFVLSIFG